MQVTYGYSVKDSEDPYILNAEAALEGFNEAGHPGAFLVDLIPALKYVPAWFPGAGFKRKAARWRQINQEVSVRPFEMVKEQLVKSLSCCAEMVILNPIAERRHCCAFGCDSFD